jgi:hypothetical protein
MVDVAFREIPPGRVVYTKLMAEAVFASCSLPATLVLHREGADATSFSLEYNVRVWTDQDFSRTSKAVRFLANRLREAERRIRVTVILRSPDPVYKYLEGKNGEVVKTA